MIGAIMTILIWWWLFSLQMVKLGATEIIFYKKCTLRTIKVNFYLIDDFHSSPRFWQRTHISSSDWFARQEQQLWFDDPNKEAMSFCRKINFHRLIHIFMNNSNNHTEKCFSCLSFCLMLLQLIWNDNSVMPKLKKTILQIAKPKLCFTLSAANISDICCRKDLRFFQTLNILNPKILPQKIQGGTGVKDVTSSLWIGVGNGQLFVDSSYTNWQVMFVWCDTGIVKSNCCSWQLLIHVFNSSLLVFFAAAAEPILRKVSPVRRRKRQQSTYWENVVAWKI